MRSKKMLWLAALAVNLLFFSLPAGADWDHKFDPEKKTSKLKDKLSLSDEQAAQVRQILESYDPDKDESFKQLQEDYMNAKKARHERMRSEISGVLSDEQREKYDAMTEEWKEGKKKRMEEKMDEHQHAEEMPAEQ